jgi:hypothetical protein
MDGIYVIKNSDNGKYVTYPGAKHSYTRSLKNARPFSGQEARDYGICSNEIIVEITAEMAG